MIEPSFAIGLSQTLLHFSWQGCLIGFLTYLIAYRFKASRNRYRVLTFGFIAMSTLPLTNISWSYPQSPLDSEIASSEERPTADSMPPEEITNTSVLPSSPVEGGIDLVGQESPNDGQNPSKGPSAPARASSQNWIFSAQLAYYTSIAYFIGISCMALRLLLGFLGVRRLRLRASPVQDASLLRILKLESARVGLRCMPDLSICAQIAVPTVVGLIHPMILIPTSLLSGMSPDEIRWILTHELLHIRRLDAWMNVFQRVSESLFFFHPMIWFLSRAISKERELCCDDGVLSRAEPSEYATALVHMAELSLGKHVKTPLQLSAAGDRPSELRFRIQRIVGTQEQTGGRGMISFSILLAVLLGLLAMTWSARAQTAPEPQDSNSPSEIEDAIATDKESKLGSLHGAVMDSDFLLVPGASVEVYSLVPNVALVRTTKSSERGWFEFDDLPRDMYTVIATRSYTKDGEQIKTSSPPQRIDLTRGYDYLRAQLQGSVDIDQERHYLTAGRFAIHGSWSASFFEEKIREQKTRTNHQLSGNRPNNSRRLNWGLHHQGIEAALHIRESAQADQRNVWMVLRNVTYRATQFRIEKSGWASSRFELQDTTGALQSLEDLALKWPMLSGAERPMYEIHLRPWDEFEFQIGSIPISNLDWKTMSIRIEVPLQSSFPEHAHNQHVGSGNVQTGWAKFDGSGAAVPQKLFTFRGRVVDGETGLPIESFRTVPASVSEYSEKSRGGYSWQDHLIANHQNGNLFWASRGYSRTRIRIDAPGYLPGFTKTSLREQGDVFVDVALYPTQGHRGAVVDGQGMPVKNALVARSTQTNEVLVREGKIDHVGNGRGLGQVVRTNEEGVFELPGEIEDGFFVAVHPTLGYAQLTPKEFEENATLKLEPWSKIEGLVVDADGEPAANQTVWASSNRSTGTGMPTISLHQEAKTGPDGAFEFTQLSPGRLHLQRGIDAEDPQGEKIQVSIPGSLVWMKLEPGKTSKVILGKPCANVVGTLVSDQIHDLTQFFVRLVPEYPPMSRTGDMSSFTTRANFLQSKVGRHYAIEVRDFGKNGEFKFDDVPAGRFQLRVFRKTDNRLVRHRSTSIDVPYSEDRQTIAAGEIPMLGDKK